MENNPVKDRNSHANFRKGLTDYNDGENVTHYLGNDEYPGSNLADRTQEGSNPLLEGKEALGNDFLEDDEEEIMEDESWPEDLNYE